MTARIVFAEHVGGHMVLLEPLRDPEVFPTFARSGAQPVLTSRQSSCSKRVVAQQGDAADDTSRRG